MEKHIMHMIIILLIVLIIILIIEIFNNTTINNCYESFSTITPVSDKWNRNECKYVMNKTLKTVLDDNNMTNSSSDWTLRFPCGYNDMNGEIEKMPKKKGAKYFIIDNCDTISGKQSLWLNVLKHHGMTKTLLMLPKTYVLYIPEDINKFKNEYDPNKIYILKKNTQRQEGLKLTNNKDEIINAYNNNKYVIVQELLQDPYVIDNRKINMRFYVLVTCKKQTIKIYVFKDGFMYYTAEKFAKNSTEMGPNITTGYIDRQVYIDNPLTHKDFQKYLDNPDRNLSPLEQNIRNQKLSLSQIVFERINQMLSEIFISFAGNICTGEKLFNNKKFQLFGVDVAVNDQLYPLVMEINKGPDMSAKDTRDSNLKISVITDMMKIIKSINNDKKTDFLNILTIKKGNIIK